MKEVGERSRKKEKKVFQSPLSSLTGRLLGNDDGTGQQERGRKVLPHGKNSSVFLRGRDCTTRKRKSGRKREQKGSCAVLETGVCPLSRCTRRRIDTKGHLAAGGWRVNRCFWEIQSESIFLNVSLSLLSVVFAYTAKSEASFLLTSMKRSARKRKDRRKEKKFFCLASGKSTSAW